MPRKDRDARMEIRTEGFGQLEKLLKKLPPKMAKSIARKAVRAGGKPIMQAYRRNLRPHLRKRTGRIGQVVKTIKSEQRVVAYVGAFRGKMPHAHLLEFGSAPRVTKKGASRGKMPAFGLLRRAFDNEAHRSSEAMRKKIGEEVAAMARKHGGR